MAGTWTSEKFPQFEAAILRLIDQHRAFQDEPLHLAIAYGPNRDHADIFLLEVIGGPFVEGISPERELFETTFSPTPGFPMEINQRLHLILTTPEEFQTAVQEKWPSAQEILDAIRGGNYQKLHSDEVGDSVLAQILAGMEQPEGAVRG